jgi:hypothetical protein
MGSFESVGIIETAPLPKKSPIDAHMRNSLILEKEIPAVLLTRREDVEKYWNHIFSSFIVSYGSFYCDFKPFEALIKRNKTAKLFWLTNEYNLNPNSAFYTLMRERGYQIIANYPQDACPVRGFDQFHRVNLNLLFARPSNPYLPSVKRYSLGYWGSFRPNRGIYFRKYFNKDLFLSTSPKNASKFLSIGCKPRFIDKLNWTKGKETLNRFLHTIYIEDEFTHDHFNFMANRFYESLFCNVVLFFDRSCKRSIEQSGIEWDNQFFVKDAQDLKAKRMLADHVTLREWQQRWNIQALGQRAALIKDLRLILHAS